MVDTPSGDATLPFLFRTGPARSGVARGATGSVPSPTVPITHRRRTGYRRRTLAASVDPVKIRRSVDRRGRGPSRAFAAGLVVCGLCVTGAFAAAAAPVAAPEPAKTASRGDDPVGADPNGPAAEPEARERTSEQSSSGAFEGLPPGVRVDWVGGAVETLDDGGYRITGSVTITTEDGVRFQADSVVLREGRYLEADGDVLMVWDTNRIAGSSMTYDLDTGEGLLTDAVGQVDPEYGFRAETVRTVRRGDDDFVYLRRAEVTTCTQPVPYWSFRVTKARVRVDGYARMWNARLKVRKMPVLYFPFIFWPVKRGRAPGLLIPEIQSTQNRGQVFRQPLYIPIGESADLTLIGSYFSLAGVGLGTEARVIPNKEGRLAFSGFFIEDDIAGRDRYRATLQQQQSFRNGFRMVADINVVSDFDYFNDFERDLELTSTPNIRGLLEFARNGRWVSMNVREFRNEQLFSDGTSLVQQTLPELEWRGRSRRLGNSPLSLSYLASVARIQQKGRQSGSEIDVDYLRGDVFPTLSVPLSPTPWFDITPSASYRFTYYTRRQELFTGSSGLQERRVVDDELSRGLGGAGVEIVGPKLFRVYRTPESGYSPAYKHSFEATVRYAYSEGFDELDEVVLFDEVDRFGTAGNSMTYGLRSRLFAKRPRTLPGLEDDEATPAVEGLGGAAGPTSPEQRPDLYDPEDRAETPSAPDDELEPVEIASLSISQTRSFDNPMLSRGDLDFDGIDDSFSSTSDITLRGRLSPNPRFDVQLSSAYQVVFDKFSRASLSGRYSDAGGRGNLTFSLTHRPGLGVVRRSVFDNATGQFTTFLEPREDDTQATLNGGINLLRGRLRLDVAGTIDFNPAEGQGRVPNRQWRVQYRTQCCVFLLERLNRGFTDVANRRDIFFRVDLRGVGKVLDQTF